MALLVNVRHWYNHWAVLRWVNHWTCWKVIIASNRCCQGRATAAATAKMARIRGRRRVALHSLKVVEKLIPINCPVISLRVASKNSTRVVDLRWKDGFPSSVETSTDSVSFAPPVFDLHATVTPPLARPTVPVRFKQSLVCVASALSTVCCFFPLILALPATCSGQLLQREPCSKQNIACMVNCHMYQGACSTFRLATTDA